MDMEYIIQGYSPISVFHYFEDISRIPRASGDEKAISDYLVDFAKSNHLEYYRDKIDNVIIKKKASKTSNSSAAVILQGHVDMVCEKNADTLHDFSKDGLKLRVVDGILMATGTTLGADNGIAVAMMLAILEDRSIVHPPLECVFTVQEETGLTGAIEIDGRQITGRTMINLDSEDEGIATVSCAGGMRARLSKEIIWEKGGTFGLKISVRGLNGGHSGMDIAKEHGNANKIMGRILMALHEDLSFQIASFNGGSKDNAIPREADAELLFCDETAVQQAIQIIAQQTSELIHEFSSVEQRLNIQTQEVQIQRATSSVFTTELIKCIYLSPNGVKNRNVTEGGFIVCSINMGVVQTLENKLVITFAPRSSIASLQNQTKKELKLMSEMFGFTFQVDSEYPGWSYAPDSKLREVFQDCYQAQTGTTLQIEAIHAGLECGLFCEKLEGLDAIAVGPSVVGCHTPDESLDLASCERVYQLLLGVLEKLSV